MVAFLIMAMLAPGLVPADPDTLTLTPNGQGMTKDRNLLAWSNYRNILLWMPTRNLGDNCLAAYNGLRYIITRLCRCLRRNSGTSQTP